VTRQFFGRIDRSTTPSVGSGRGQRGGGSAPARPRALALIGGDGPPAAIRRVTLATVAAPSKANQLHVPRRFSGAHNSR